ncbi:hypothetical protein H5410_051363 [Solanum commersonii]|uniref:Aminotransferase-like plant mobile domain-containing protein n=1 Tax=Solanum commersonii TaxID=4109 RepID=A0A9J5X0Q9_SOLCO|nr:hypothetical protein H5410_051363 [Solanum commersonii]
MVNWTSVHTHTTNNLLNVWSLQAPDHHHANIATSLPSLGRCIIQGEIRWGNTMTIEGEYYHIQGYWEWTENILGSSQEVLGTAQIYDVIYASLFTYDRNSDILQAFCEDLIVSEAKELVGSIEKRTKYIPRTCEYLFAAFHHLRGAYQELSFSRWISFWCKEPQMYESAPPREEKKFARPKSTHNPSGDLLDIARWLHVEERMFSVLGVRVDKKDETYLAAFLSCWLCAFVLPNKEGEFVPPRTFKMANIWGVGRRSIFRSRFKTHYAFSNGPFVPTMVVYSGEGGARYFDSNNDIKCIHGGENVAWTSTMLDKAYPYFHALVDVARPIPVVHLEGSGEVCKNKVLNTAPKRKTPTQAAYVSKRLLKEKSQDSGESISCSHLMKLPLVTQVKKGPPSVSCDEVKDDLGYEARKHPPPAMSICNGNKVILDAQKDFISALWNVIKGKLSRSDVDSASSLRHEIQ